MPGVVRTRVGYTGGTKKNPTYYSLGDHTETFQLDFDPQQISYDKLLGMFWSYPNSCASTGSRQYMSAIFYANDEQKKLALASREREEKKRQKKITTPILPLAEFYLAEDYHQKYRLRNDRDLMREFAAMFPNDKDFVNSTAAARVNGYLAGNGKLGDLEKEVANYGLSESAKQKLLDLAKRNR